MSLKELANLSYSKFIRELFKFPEYPSESKTIKLFILFESIKNSEWNTFFFARTDLLPIPKSASTQKSFSHRTD